MKVFICSKMIQKVVLLFTMLSIFEELKDVHCVNYISDEFNLMCYVSMYHKIQMIINYKNQNPNEPINYLTSEIGVFNQKLLRVNSWKKYLNEPWTIWVNFSNIISWAEHPNDAEFINHVLADITSTIDRSKFKVFSWMTPRGKKFSEILQITDTTTDSDEQIENMVLTTFRFCKETLNILSASTAVIEVNLGQLFLMHAYFSFPVSSYFGCVILLGKDNVYLEHIKNKSDNTQAMSLVYIIDDALQDIYIGIMNTLRRINISSVQVSEYLENTGAYIIEVELMKMMMTVYHNVVKLTEELYHTKSIRGVDKKINILIKEKIKSSSIKWVCDYESFNRYFQQTWTNKLLFVLKNDESQSSSSVSGGSQDNSSVPLLVGRGRLIENGRVEPSIIGYYAVYEESWENMEAIDYVKNTDDRIVILMELNAWAIVLHENLQDLRKFLKDEGLRAELPNKLDFAQDIEFIKKFESWFQRNSL